MRLWEMIANVYRSLTLYKVHTAGPCVSGRAERNGRGWEGVQHCWPETALCKERLMGVVLFSFEPRYLKEDTRHGDQD